MVYVPVHSAGTAGRRRLIRRLRSDGAVSEGSARPLEPLSRLEEKALKRALSCGIIRQAKGGGYYIDEERVAQARTRELRAAGIAILFMLLAFGILFVLGEIP